MYEKYGLFDNPFKREHNHRIVGTSQKKTFAKLLDFLWVSSASGERSGDRFISVLKGEYGYGKSFFDIKLMESILSRDKDFKKHIKGDGKFAVSYFEMLPPDRRLPSKLMLHLYQSIIGNLGIGGERFVFSLYGELKDRSNASGKKVEDLIGDLDQYFQRAILKLDESSPVQYMAWKWISAQKLTGGELKDLGIPFKIDSSELAEKYIFNLLKLLKILDYGLLVVLIDEFEQVLTTVNEKAFLRSFVVLQGIYDNFVNLKYKPLTPMTPIGFICGVTEAAWEAVERGAEQDEEAIQAVRARIHNNVFEFEKFNRETVREFIEMLLGKARARGFKGKPLFPFDEGSIEAISEHTDGNPGVIIAYCGGLLEFAYRKKSPQIDAKLTQDYFSSIGGGVDDESIASESETDFLEEEEKL